MDNVTLARATLRLRIALLLPSLWYLFRVFKARNPAALSQE